MKSKQARSIAKERLADIGKTDIRLAANIDQLEEIRLRLIAYLHICIHENRKDYYSNAIADVDHLVSKAEAIRRIVKDKAYLSIELSIEERKKGD
jgi:hypothetical protein